MTFAQRFNDERAQCVRAGLRKPMHCYLGVAQWAEFELETLNFRTHVCTIYYEENRQNYLYKGIEMHRLMEPSHFRFS